MGAAHLFLDPLVPGVMFERIVVASCLGLARHLARDLFKPSRYIARALMQRPCCVKYSACRIHGQTLSGISAPVQSFSIDTFALRAIAFVPSRQYAISVCPLPLISFVSNWQWVAVGANAMIAVCR